MGDDEETTNCTFVSNDPPIHGVESTIDDRPLEEIELTGVEQCDESVSEGVFNSEKLRSVGVEPCVSKEEVKEMVAKDDVGNFVADDGVEEISVPCANALSAGVAELEPVVKDEDVGTVVGMEGNVFEEGIEESSGPVADNLAVTSELVAVGNDEDAEALVGYESNIVAEVGEDSIPLPDGLPVGGLELASSVEENEAKTSLADSENLETEGVNDAVKSIPTSEDLPVTTSEFVPVFKGDEEAVPVGGVESVDVVALKKEGDLMEGIDKVKEEEEAVGCGDVVSSAEVHVTESDEMGPSGIVDDDKVSEAVVGIDKVMEKEAVASGNAVSSAEVHVTESAEMGPSGIEDDDKVSESVVAMEVEAGASAGEGAVVLTKEGALMEGIDMMMEEETAVSRNVLSSSEVPGTVPAEIGSSGVVDDDKVAGAVVAMKVEAGAKAGDDDVVKTPDEVSILWKKEEHEEIPPEETKTHTENKVEGEAACRGEVLPAEDNDIGANVDIASQQVGEDDVEMKSEIKGSESGRLLEVNDFVQPGDVSHIVADEDEEDAPMVEEEVQTMDTEMETETEMESGKGLKGKRKRGKIAKVPSARASSRKTVGEDVCFICFDGGDLVLCDRRGCPKAYHPSCVNRDEAFFRAKGKWNCGWHLCSICERNAHYMCYTCPFSLCKGCVKDAVILCIRRNKGFCESCIKMVMLIEEKYEQNLSQNKNNEQEAKIDFDDKSSWEYLFKDYYMELKEKLSLSSIELTQTKNPWKGYGAMTNKPESPDEPFDTNDDIASGSDNSSENKEMSKTKRRKTKKSAKSLTEEEDSTVVAVSKRATVPGITEWASKELLEFVMHMRNGDKSALSQFDVQALLLEYIKQNKLRDPRRKSQIVCDSRLENLFGKARVGHFEMLKLLESHFFVREDSRTDDIQGSVVDTELNQTDTDGNIDQLNKGSKDKKRKNRKKGNGRGPQSNLDDYAAIDMHNINLIYLRRKLMEDLLEDNEKIHDKVVGVFVRIRISGSNLKQDIYRLVQVVGTSKATEPYKVGKRTTEVMLEILNLNKTEVISIDTISNQEFTEDECKRLRQSIKCGLINRLTVGDVLDRAMEVHAARVNDWLETETVRLSHLRDRASEKGRKKELRECVEKLQLLKTPDEKRRRLDDIPEIHADPKMDPSYESEDDESDMDTNKRDTYTRLLRGSDISRRMKEPISPRSGDFSSKDSWNSTRNYSNKNWELTRTLSNKTLPNKAEETSFMGEVLSEKASWNPGEKDARKPTNLEKVSSATISESIRWNDYSTAKSEQLSAVVSETLPSVSPGVGENVAKINETEKVWHYQDPSGKVQGPFSMAQLRKWNKTGYFPVDLKVWRTRQNQGDSILLTDVLAGRLQKESPLEDNINLKATSLHSTDFPTEIVKLPSERRGSDFGGGSDSLNLPSPTPRRSVEGWSGGTGHITHTNTLQVGSGSMQSPAVASISGSQFSHSTPSLDVGGNREQNAVGSLGVSSPGSVVNSTGQIKRASRNDTSIVYPSGDSTHNSEYLAHIASANIVQPSPSPNNSHVLQSHSHLTSSSDSPVQTVQSVGSQNPNTETRERGRQLEPNSSMTLPGQTLNYSQWTGVPSANHSSSDNFSNLGVSAVPPVAPWGSQVPGIQSSMQPSGQSNVPWGIGVDNNSSVPTSRPPENNVNAGWGPMQGNSNVGWGGPMPGNMNMNWGAIPQGPSPGNPGPGWVMPTGNQGVTVQGPMQGNLNPVWAAPTMNPGVVGQGMQTGPGNSGWATPNGNMGAPVQQMVPGNGTPGWIPPTGNTGSSIPGPPPGNANQGWGGVPANQNAWGGGQQQNGDRNSNQVDNRGPPPQGGDLGFNGGRPWNRQSSSFGNGSPGFSRHFPKRQVPCPYHQMGYCKKGANCDYMHG